MRHPTDGTLRRLLDEPAGVADADRAHVAGCPVCLAELAAVRSDAELAGAVLRHDADPDVDAAWTRLSGALATRPDSVAGVSPERSGGALRRPARGARRWAALRSPV